MKCLTRRFVVLSIVLLAGLVSVPEPYAQEVSPENVDRGQELESDARGLAEAIEEKNQELTSLGQQIASASGDDVIALRERAIEIVSEYRIDLDNLATNVVEREELGMDVADDRAEVTGILVQTAEFMRRSIERSQEELSALRASRDGAAPEELEKIDRLVILQSTWLDRLLDMHLDHTLVMEAFGLEIEVDRDFLSGKLTERAELLSGRVMVMRERLEKVERRVKGDPSSAEFNTELDMVSAQLDRDVEQLVTTTRMMESLGLDTADYQQLLFQVTGEITTGLFSREVLAGLFKSWFHRVMDWLTHNGPSLILKLVLFVLIIFAFRILSRIARKVVQKGIKTSHLQVSTLLERTALSVTGTVVMIFGLLVALSQLGFQIAPLLAGLGVAGFIVGFALQDTLSNFASGVMILLYRPYDVGDLVEAAGAFGNVKNMTLVSTTILTLDHQTLVIPNNKIWGDVIKNVTAQKERRVDMVFGIGYADDIPHAERVLREIVEAHDKVLEDPAPNIKLHTLNESSVDFVVRPWVATDDYWDVYWDITREVKIRFDAEGISIPFPQRDVHIFKEGAAGVE